MSTNISIEIFLISITGHLRHNTSVAFYYATESYGFPSCKKNKSFQSHRSQTTTLTELILYIA